MKMNRVKTWYITLFTLIAGSVLLYFSITRPLILVIHSYNTDYQWVRDVNNAFEKATAHKPFYRITYHYMDTKNNPEEDLIQKSAKQSLKLINDTKPDVVVIFDDNAQRVVGSKLINKPNTRVVYAGVNATPEIYGYTQKAKNITGITESIPLPSLKELIEHNINLGILPKKPRVIHLADASSSVRLDDQNIQKLPHYHKSHLVKTTQEWKNVIKQGKDAADLIIISNYQNLKPGEGEGEGEKLDTKELISWTQNNTQVPIIGIIGFNVIDGLDFALGTSPNEQGRVAAELALSLSNPLEDISKHPARRAKEITVYLRSKLKEPHLILPSIYESFARATAHYYE